MIDQPEEPRHAARNRRLRRIQQRRRRTLDRRGRSQTGLRARRNGGPRSRGIERLLGAVHLPGSGPANTASKNAPKVRAPRSRAARPNPPKRKPAKKPKRLEPEVAEPERRSRSGAEEVAPETGGAGGTAKAAAPAGAAPKAAVARRRIRRHRPRLSGPITGASRSPRSAGSGHAPMCAPLAILPCVRRAAWFSARSGLCQEPSHLSGYFSILTIMSCTWRTWDQ